MIGAEQLTNQEGVQDVRVPEFARLAGAFIATAETSPDPVCIDEFLYTDLSAQEVLRNSLDKAKEFSKRHKALFDLSDIPYVYPKGREKEILALTAELIEQVKAEQRIYWSVSLGLETLKNAEVAAQLAADSSLALVPLDEDIQASLGDKVCTLTDGAFDSFAHKITGSISKWPQARLGYPGQLLDIHYGFWRERRKLLRLDTSGALPAGMLEEDIQKVLSLAPKKTRLIDTHSLAGRPDRKDMEESYQTKISAFLQSLEAGESDPGSAAVSAPLAVKLSFMALDSALHHGYSSKETLRITAQNSPAIGRLTRRVTDNVANLHPSMFHFIGSRTHPLLVIDHPKTQPESHLTEDIADKLERRDQDGGVCVVRNPIPLQPNGRTHQNVISFLGATKNRIGATPVLLREVKGTIYLDPAALAVGNALLAIADNYRASA